MVSKGALLGALCPSKSHLSAKDRVERQKHDSPMA